MTDPNNLDEESSKNLRAYARLLWRIFKRRQEEAENKSDDELLKEEWEKRSK